MMYKLRKTVPVGIKPLPVWLMSLSGLVISILISAGGFISGFLRQLNRVSQYYPETGERIFLEDEKMEAFSRCLYLDYEAFKLYFLLLAIFAVYCVVYHFMGAKSVYTMRRLKNPFELYIRCFSVTVLSVITGIAAVYIMNYIFIEIYLSVIPKENLFSLWDANAWRCWK